MLVTGSLGATAGWSLGGVSVIPVTATDGGGFDSGVVGIMPANADALNANVNTTAMLSCRSFLISFS